MSGKFARVKRRLELESLESRKCLAADLGWDGAGLGSANLSYYIGPVPASVGLTQDQVAAAVKTALDAWSSAAAIKFTPTNLPNQQRSLDITFAKLDGPGGTLAQAYFPGDSFRSTIGGDVQFDLSDTWEVGNARGAAATDLTYVAVHEIGHALGVDHISGASSVMNPSVSPTQAFSKLDPAAVDAIHALYAPAPSSTSGTSASTDGALGGAAGGTTAGSGSTGSSGASGSTHPTSPPTTSQPRTSPFSNRGFRHGGRWTLPWVNFNSATDPESSGDTTSNSNGASDPTTTDGTTSTTPNTTAAGSSKPTSADPTATDGTTNSGGSGATGTTNGTDGTGGATGRCPHGHVQPETGGTGNSSVNGDTSIGAFTSTSNGSTTSSSSTTIIGLNRNSFSL
ncbi:MAG TPA: matrixin family metalloprotease, partial [Pirellulaceae bacterium]|nr:matrixin family metalloprotease [Pirellulaceae bacterium]